MYFGQLVLVFIGAGLLAKCNLEIGGTVDSVYCLVHSVHAVTAQAKLDIVLGVVNRQAFVIQNSFLLLLLRTALFTELFHAVVGRLRVKTGLYRELAVYSFGFDLVTHAHGSTDGMLNGFERLWLILRGSSSI